MIESRIHPPMASRNSFYQTLGDTPSSWTNFAYNRHLGPAIVAAETVAIVESSRCFHLPKLVLARFGTHISFEHLGSLAVKRVKAHPSEA